MKWIWWKILTIKYWMQGDPWKNAKLLAKRVVYWNWEG